MSNKKGLPEELPERPEGFTRKLNVHFNYGSKGDAAVYDVFSPTGKKMPFCYQYDTREGGLTGLSLPEVEGVFTWAEMREFWPKWLKGETKR